MKLKTVGFVAALCVAGGLVASQASADILIDDFSSVGNPDPWPVVVNTITTVNINETGLSNVLGGARYSSISAQYLQFFGLDYVQAAIVPNYGMLLDYSSTSGADGSWSLLYDANGAGLNTNITGMTDIKLDFGQFDFSNGQPLPVAITLFDGTNTVVHSESLVSPGAQTLDFALANFAGIGGLNTSSIQSITVSLDPALAGDFRLDQMYLVPTPGSLALFALGSLCVVGRRRHTRQDT